MGIDLIRNAIQYEWTITFDNDHDGRYDMDVGENILTLSHHGLHFDRLDRSDFFRNSVIFDLCLGLRDIWHETRHGSFEGTPPEGLLMLERVRQADCFAVSFLVAWEMRSESAPDVWRHVIGSEDGDIAMMFTRVLDRDPTALYNGRALFSAFRQWYADPSRVDTCDHMTLEMLDDRLAMMPDCPDYMFAREEPLSWKSVEILSCLPDKTAYLRGQGDTILRDPFFAGLSDAINQSHFMQIVYDLQVVRVGDVPFRDPSLAKKIFPAAPNQLQGLSEYSLPESE